MLHGANSAVVMCILEQAYNRGLEPDRDTSVSNPGLELREVLGRTKELFATGRSALGSLASDPFSLYDLPSRTTFRVQICWHRSIASS
jgi:hypothetical protein